MNKETNVICAPFIPDEEHPYIFVSYAHADRELVFPIIKRIYEKGWRIWYDEGLEIGNDYYGSLKKHIQDCAIFLLFASQNAFNSHFITTCEIPQAREFNKKIIVFHLEKDYVVDIPELYDATYTDDVHIESTLGEIEFLHRMKPRKAIGHQVNSSVLKQIRDSRFKYVKCAGGIRITKIENNDPIIYIPEVYPPFSDINVVELEIDIFWKHTNLTTVYLPNNLREIDLSGFLNNKLLKDIYIPAGVKVTNKYRVNLNDVPYVIHCVKGSHAHMFAEKFGLKTILKNDSSSNECSKSKPYAYVSISYIGESKSFSTIMELEEHRCNYILGRMGGGSKKKIHTSIQNCTCFVAFIDKNYVESDEINDLRTAISLGKKVAIYQMEECDLPEDLVNLQSVHQLRYNTGSEEERAIKLINWLTANNCRDLYEYNDFEYEANDEGISLTKYTGRYVNPHIEPFFCGIPVISISGLYNCEFVESISIPEGVQEISYGAFSGCSRLRSITIPSTITKIGNEAFKDCIRLNHLDIPQTIQSIGNGAFKGCTKLKSISFPSHIPISKGVYQGWPNLKKLEFQRMNLKYLALLSVIV